MRRGWVLLGLGVATYLLSLALAQTGKLVETVYGSALGPWIARSLSLLTGWVPFSVAALLVVLLATSLLSRLVKRLTTTGPAEESLGRAALRGADLLAGIVGALTIAFYVTWGFNYARPPLEDRAGFATADSMGVEELKLLTLEAAARANQTYRALHGGSRDVGSATDVPFPLGPGSRSLEAGWAVAAPQLGLPGLTTRRYGSVKALGVTSLLDALDLSGVYSPFTGEAHVAGNLPSVALPAVVAHEQAHQRGFAQENEATFAGLLAAIQSGDPLIVYSGWARVLRTLMGDLRRADSGAADEVLEYLDGGVIRDWEELARWYREHRSPAGPVATAVNDRYLRAHGVPGGVLNYGRVTELLVGWARANEGTLVPGGGG